MTQPLLQSSLSEKVTAATTNIDKRIAIALATVAALLLLLVNEAAYWQSKAAMDTLVARASSRITIERLIENVIIAESAQRDFVFSGNESLLGKVGKATAAVASTLADLEQDHATQEAFMAALSRARATIETRLARVGQGVALRRQGRVDEALALVQIVSSMELIQALDNELLAIEDEGRMQRRETVYTSLLIARIGAAAVIALGLLVLLAYMRHGRAVLKHETQVKQAEQTARIELQTEVALQTTELTALTRNLMVNREDERSRLARDLHDDLGALLTSAKLDVARLKTRMVKSAPDSLELLAHLVTTLNACVSLGRNIIENLRPSALENLGLVATLEILTGEFAKMSGIETLCELEPVALDASAELMVYRVVQEALTNITRYANASQVRVSLRAQGDQVLLSVSDNGGGFDTHSKSPAAYGLRGMRFRVEAEGGTLGIISSPGNGTRIVATLTLPLSKGAPELI